MRRVYYLLAAIGVTGCFSSGSSNGGGVTPLPLSPKSIVLNVSYPSGITASDFTDIKALPVKLLNESTGNVSNYIVEFGKSYAITNLSADNTYSVASQGIGNALSSGSYYSGYYESAIHVSTQGSTDVALTLNKVNSSNIFTSTLGVTGLDLSVETPLLVLTEIPEITANNFVTYTNSYVYQPVLLENAMYSFVTTSAPDVTVTVPSGYVLDSISEKNITSSTGTVAVKYIAESLVTYGSLTLSATNPDTNSFTTIKSLKVRILDESTGIVTPLVIPFGNGIKFESIPTNLGHTYSIMSQGIANPLTGVYYSGYKQTGIPFTNSMSVALSLTAQTAARNITGIISGLDSGTPAPTLTFSDAGLIAPVTVINIGQYNGCYSYEPVSLVSNNTYKFLSSSVPSVSVTTPEGYTLTSISPNPITTGTPTLTATYSKVAAYGSLTLSVNNPNTTSFTNITGVKVKILRDGTTNIIESTIQFGGSIKIANIPQGSYSIVSQGIANPKTGDYYSGAVVTGLSVLSNNVSQVLNLSKVTLGGNNSFSSTSTVSGLDAGVTPTLTLTGSDVIIDTTNMSNYANYYTYEPVSLINATSYKFLNTTASSNLTINPSIPSGYSVVVTPNIMTSGTTAFTATYSKSAVTFKKINATYWSAWGNNTSYSLNGTPGTYTSLPVAMPDIDMSYNVIITAFIITDASGNYVLATYDPGTGSAATAYYTKAQIQDFVTTTKAQGRKVIVSLGGQYFNLIMRQASSSADIANFVAQVEGIVDTYGFDGIDLDLEGSAIGSNTDIPSLAQAVMQVVNHYRNQGQDFWLTMAPEWVYITPAMWACGQYGGGSYAATGYIKLTQALGIGNISYIWPQTYNQGSGNGVCTPALVKVGPNDGMDTFVAGMAWSLTTESGYALSTNNQAEKMPMIPANKLVLGIPATLGAAGGGMMYVMTPALISSSWNIMASYGISIGGFMNWAADWDATPYSNSSYSFAHTAWQTGQAVATTIGLQ